MRWIVDGMNVIGSRPDGWWKDRHGAMIALVEKLDRWARAEGCCEKRDVTVVFERPPSIPIGSTVIRVAHAPRAAADSADDEIVRIVQTDPQPAEIHVVTSDKALTYRLQRIGASVHRAEGFRDLIDPRGSKTGERHGN
ncbi:MAG: NYN domain-containing protein [Mycobacterium sp.]|uniref:NYN domain-containing protein n=1 Tax=Mycobacterium sp. TaxID=1785 RepID=UPI001EBB2715|nr:NYN domain-containing protein [Mycobacterium sp.]MBW0016219.1 NYN domain-containing protein [Mycobacterium sp.]